MGLECYGKYQYWENQQNNFAHGKTRINDFKKERIEKKLRFTIHKIKLPLLENVQDYKMPSFVTFMD